MHRGLADAAQGVRQRRSRQGVALATDARYRILERLDEEGDEERARALVEVEDGAQLGLGARDDADLDTGEQRRASQMLPRRILLGAIGRVVDAEVDLEGPETSDGRSRGGGRVVDPGEEAGGEIGPLRGRERHGDAQHGGDRRVAHFATFITAPGLVLWTQ